MNSTLDVRASDVSKVEVEKVHTFAEGLDDSPLRTALMTITENVSTDTDTFVMGSQDQLTPNQAAKILKMSRTHLRKLLDDGEIPHVLVGSDRRITATDLKAFETKRQAERKKLAESFAHHDTIQDAAIDELVDES
ncbi:helix-turn-helix domain-containing protein [Arthrobacter castelli]|uniref:helix-turn-helix domain-containing protein n=1 Tax=Arthrobacter castelli TaxID=271431 RepID=UPI0003F540A0|nr:helix-turn-helix domain-containing protein [Arthrobacter castelli]